MTEQNIYTKEDVEIKNILSTRIKDLTGEHFGKWDVLGYAGNNNDNKSLWWCVCRCNDTKFYKIVGTELSRGKTTSCGCNVVEENKRRAFIEQYANSYGLTKESYKRIYRIYNGMNQRCYNTKSKDYAHYGARGIRICQEWKENKDAFIQWCVNNGYKDNLTIERIDVNDDYKPSNCIWITEIEQASNKTTTKYIIYNGEKLKLIDFLRSIGCETHKEQNLVRTRIFRYGWEVEEAIKEYI